jgi:hypothetical protein
MSTKHSTIGKLQHKNSQVVLIGVVLNIQQRPSHEPQPHSRTWALRSTRYFGTAGQEVQSIITPKHRCIHVRASPGSRENLMKTYPRCRITLFFSVPNSLMLFTSPGLLVLTCAYKFYWRRSSRRPSL